MISSRYHLQKPWRLHEKPAQTKPRKIGRFVVPSQRSPVCYGLDTISAGGPDLFGHPCEGSLQSLHWLLAVRVCVPQPFVFELEVGGWFYNAETLGNKKKTAVRWKPSGLFPCCKLVVDFRLNFQFSMNPKTKAGTLGREERCDLAAAEDAGLGARNSEEVRS